MTDKQKTAHDIVCSLAKANPEHIGTLSSYCLMCGGVGIPYLELKDHAPYCLWMRAKNYMAKTARKKKQ